MSKFDGGVDFIKLKVRGIKLRVFEIWKGLLKMHGSLEVLCVVSSYQNCIQHRPIQNRFPV
jgi:hypothetical protein